MEKGKNLLSELPYQEKIRNIDIHKKEGVRVNMIAFPEGTELKPHISLVDVLVIVLEGEAEVEMQGKKYSLAPLDYIKFPADVKHSVKAKTEFKMLMIK
ncbi:cupin domain-containing protein [Fulvivirgaceae bacterium BMA10]|uniref:Cupin domain-containing protein n=1 Tax=Splendidivirga corallicola TaxID=3051826 RepID=A0ABT8KY29_9BACT|nr:cupin domain-containing protein [Fulvivirgaceae bacterium BMA10]